MMGSVIGGPGDEGNLRIFARYLDWFWEIFQINFLYTGNLIPSQKKYEKIKQILLRNLS